MSPRVVWCYLVRVYTGLRVVLCCLVPPRVRESVSFLLAVIEHGVNAIERAAAGQVGMDRWRGKA